MQTIMINSLRLFHSILKYKNNSMKTILNSFIWLMLTAIMLVSCENDGIDPLSDKYTPPEVYAYTVLNSQIREREGSLYIFSINLTDSESNTINMKFFSSNDTLPASDYTPSETAVNSTYLIGSEGSTCNDQEISGSTVSVSLQDTDYTMKGILYLADGTVVKMTASFSIAFEPDIYVPTYTYSVETETPALGGAQSSTPIPGTTKHKVTFFADDEFYAYFDIVTGETATSLSGSYTIKDGLDAAGQIANGFYFDLAWMGASGVIEGGSFYMKDDEKMFIREGDGDIVIVDNEGILTLSGENLSILDVEALINSGGQTWTTLAKPGVINIQEATEVIVP